MLHTTSYIRQKTKKKSIPLIQDNNKSLHFLFQKNSNVLSSTSLRSKKRYNQVLILIQLTMMPIVPMIGGVVDEVVARRRVVPPTMMMVVVVMVVMMMMTLPSMLVIKGGGGGRCWGESEPARAGRRATRTLAQGRGCLDRLHLGLHQGGEDGLEACHLHTTATIVRGHCLVSDIGGGRSHRHHLFAYPGHITFTGLDRDHFVIGTVAGLLQGPLTERSQNRRTRILPLLLLLLSSFFHGTIHWKISNESGQHVADYLLSSFILWRIRSRSLIKKNGLLRFTHCFTTEGFERNDCHCYPLSISFSTNFSQRFLLIRWWSMLVEQQEDRSLSRFGWDSMGEAN